MLRKYFRRLQRFFCGPLVGDVYEMYCTDNSRIKWIVADIKKNNILIYTFNSLSPSPIKNESRYRSIKSMWAGANPELIEELS